MCIYLEPEVNDCLEFIQTHGYELDKNEFQKVYDDRSLLPGELYDKCVLFIAVTTNHNGDYVLGVITSYSDVKLFTQTTNPSEVRYFIMDLDAAFAHNAVSEENLRILAQNCPELF
jgi:hypothetical protein